MSNALEICSNCGKGEEESCNLKECGAYFLVKYCSRNCQAAHRAQHKKACKKRAAELFHEKLFQVPPPRKECPICMIPLPVDNDNGQQEIFKTCCGNFICNGCWYVMTTKAQGEGKSFEETLCAYCRTREYRGDEEFIERLEDHMERGNSDAISALGSIYCEGIHGLPQDMAKANELFLKAGELGCSGGYYNLGKAYDLGRGVDINKKKARHFYELAAIMGELSARGMLAGYEFESGNVTLAIKHVTISARAGHTASMDTLRNMKRVGGLMGHVTNDEYELTLRGYNQRQNESKSEERDKATLMLEELCRMGVVGGVGPGTGLAV